VRRFPEESEVAMPANEEPIGVGLAEAIGQVRAELERAVEEGEGSSVAFRSGPVELESRWASPGPAGSAAVSSCRCCRSR
jgi:hypothetical protein